MDPTSKTPNEATPGSAGRNGRNGRRRWEMTTADVRYFLPKPGTSTENPELGREVATEAEALVEAFRTDQPFYTLVAWNASSETDGGVPRIVKEAVKRD